MPSQAKPAAMLGIRTLEGAAQVSSSPYAQGIVSIASDLLSAIQTSKSVQDSAHRLTDRILEACDICVEFLREPASWGDMDVSHYMGQIIRSLEELDYSLRKQPKRGFWGKLLARAGDAAVIRAAEDELDHSLQLFQMQLQMRAPPLVADIGQDPLSSSRIQDLVEKNYQEELDLIKKSRQESSNRNKSREMSPNYQPPPKSLIFFGREDAVDHLVSSLSKPQSYEAVLGPGGIGKTSLAIAAIQDPKVVHVYGSNRYFVSCEGLRDAKGIIAQLADIFKVKEDKLVQELTTALQQTNKPIIIFLDNLETVWEPAATRRDVEDLMTQLSNIPQISLLITLRGAERPSGVAWSRPFLRPLQPLDYDDARRTFLAISDVSDTDPNLEELLGVTDGVPLAVTLLACQAQTTGCEELLGTWHKLKTASITRGFEGRLSSLDVSIRLSLGSERLTNVKDATRLLQVLSYLPDGAALSELQCMVDAGFNVLAASIALRQVSLASSTDNQRLRVLSPIREYVLQNIPLEDVPFKLVLDYHSSLSKRAADSEHGFECWAMVEELAPSIGNIYSVVRSSWSHPAHANQGVQCVIDIASFHRISYRGSSNLLISEAIEQSRRVNDQSLEADCLYALARQDQASGQQIPCFEAAISIYRDLNDNDRLAWTLLYKAVGLHNALQYDQARKALDEVSSIVSDASPSHLRAEHQRVLAATLLDDGKERLEACNKALSMIDHRQYPFTVGKVCLAMCAAYLDMSRYIKSIEAAQTGLTLIAGEPHYITAWLYEFMTQALLGLSRYSEAKISLMKAYDLFCSLGIEDKVASCQVRLGQIAVAFHDFTAAESHYHIATNLQKFASDSYRLSCYRGDMELRRGNLSTAWAHLEYAVHSFPTIRVGHPLWLFTITPMSDVLYQSGRFEEALVSTVLATAVCSKGGGMALGTCVQRIGDYFYSEGDWNSAAACYKCSLDMISMFGCLKRIADLRLRLAYVAFKQANAVSAETQLELASTLYLRASHQVEAKYCQQLTDSLHQPDFKMEDLLPVASRFV